MEAYNRNISKKLLQADLNMIHHQSQPEMFYNNIKDLDYLNSGKEVFKGGNRSLKYVQTGNNVQAFAPSNLSVGSGMSRKRGRPRKVNGGSIWDDIQSVAKTAAPFAPLLLAAAGLPKKTRTRKTKGGDILTDMMAMGGMGLHEKKRRGRKPREAGGSFFDSLKSGLKSVGSTVAPMAKEILVPVASDMAKSALTNYMSGTPTAGAGLKRRPGRPKKDHGGNFLDDFSRGLSNVVKTVSPIAQSVAVPLAQQALTSYMTKGAGLKQKRPPTKRNLMIKHIMSKSGCSLAEASKHIKANHLI
jgi:hypothetical protein